MRYCPALLVPAGGGVCPNPPECIPRWSTRRPGRPLDADPPGNADLPLGRTPHADPHGCRPLPLQGRHPPL